MPVVAAVVKWALSLGLLLLIIFRVDVTSLPTSLLTWNTSSAIFAATMLLILQGFLAAWRQIDIVSMLGFRILMAPSLRVWFAGLFINQVGLTFIASDVMRGLQFAREGVPNRAAGRAVVLDRIVGLAVLLLMVDAVLPFVASLSADETLWYGLLILSCISTGGLFLLLLANFLNGFRKRLPARIAHNRILEIGIDLASVSRFLYAHPKRSFRIAALSAVMHLLNVVSIVWIALSLGAEASPWAMAAVLVPVMFLSMLPISIAGWGVREAAAITALSLLKVPAQVALISSVAFGIAAILASLPGILVLIAKRRSLPSSNDLRSTARDPERS